MSGAMSSRSCAIWWKWQSRRRGSENAGTYALARSYSAGHIARIELVGRTSGARVRVFHAGLEHSNAMLIWLPALIVLTMLAIWLQAAIILAIGIPALLIGLWLYAERRRPWSDKGEERNA